MRRSVWKYPLRNRDTILMLPAGAEVIHFAVQNEVACVWMIVRPELTALQERRFVAYGTGDVFDDIGKRYVATALTADGSHVWHLFEVI